MHAALALRGFIWYIHIRKRESRYGRGERRQSDQRTAHSAAKHHISTTPKKEEEKIIKRIFRAVLCALVILSILIPTTALAASSTYKGTGSSSYTIETKKKDATLTISISQGKAIVTTSGTRFFSLFDDKGETKTKTQNLYGSFNITVKDANFRTVYSGNLGGGMSTKTKTTVKLEKNSTYHVSVSYAGVQGAFTNNFAIFQSWKKDPSIKISVNNWASIY